MKSTYRLHFHAADIVHMPGSRDNPTVTTEQALGGYVIIIRKIFHAYSLLCRCIVLLIDLISVMGNSYTTIYKVF